MRLGLGWRELLSKPPGCVVGHNGCARGSGALHHQLSTSRIVGTILSGYVVFVQEASANWNNNHQLAQVFALENTTSASFRRHVVGPIAYTNDQTTWRRERRTCFSLSLVIISTIMMVNRCHDSWPRWLGATPHGHTRHPLWHL